MISKSVITKLEEILCEPKMTGLCNVGRMKTRLIHGILASYDHDLHEHAMQCNAMQVQTAQNRTKSRRQVLDRQQHAFHSAIAGASLGPLLFMTRHSSWR